MANTPVEFEAPSGLTLTVKLFPHGSDEAAGASPYSATERTNAKGVYSITVAAALTGWHNIVVLSGSTPIALGHVFLADTTTVHRAGSVIGPADRAGADNLDRAISAVLTTAMAESYNADGSPPTPSQALFVIMQRLTEFSKSGSTITVKRLDGTTTAFTLTLDSADAPTSSARSA